MTRQPRPDAGGEARDAVVVFARAPRPGEVKTRLAAEVGDRAAARIYARMGRTVVDALRGGPWTLTVAFTPADAEDELRAWLGDGPRYRPQRGAGLGARLEDALGRALDTSDRACVVGTDAPDLTAGRVRLAFRSLAEHDLVLGPARDGGYYLLALRAPHPPLFREIPWSTPGVLAATLDRAGELGLSAHLLPGLADVDRLEDVPPRLRTLLDG